MLGSERACIALGLTWQRIFQAMQPNIRAGRPAGAGVRVRATFSQVAAGGEGISAARVAAERAHGRSAAAGGASSDDAAKPSSGEPQRPRDTRVGSGGRCRSRTCDPQLVELML